MACTGWTTSNYLQHNASVYQTRPYMFAIWVNLPAAPGGFIRFCQQGNISNEYFDMSISSTPELWLTDQGATTFENIAETGTITTNTWFLATGQLLAQTSRRVERNAANGTDGSTDVGTIGTADLCRIGGNAYGTVTSFSNTGGLAECSIWGGSMSSANMTSLAGKLFNGGAGGAGGNPLNINAETAQPWSGQLKAYWPLTTHTDLADAFANFDLTMTGTITTFGSHPNVEAVSGGGSINLMPQIWM